MQTEADLCPGFVVGRHGVNGICSCGLYWEGEMPPHDTEGRPVRLDRILRRAVERSMAEGARRDNRLDLRRHGVEKPLAPGLRLTQW